MADSPPRQTLLGTTESTTKSTTESATAMIAGKKPIASRRGTKPLAIPLPEPSSSALFAFHRSSRTPGGGRTPADGATAARSPDVAVVLTPTLPSTPQPRAKPHHAATAAAAAHHPPRRSTAADGAEGAGLLHAAGAAAGAAPPPPCRRQASHSPCCKVHWRRVVVAFLLMLSLTVFLLMLPALWLTHLGAWPLQSLPSGSLDLSRPSRSFVFPARFEPLKVPFSRRRPWYAEKVPESSMDLPSSHLRRHVGADFFTPRVGNLLKSPLKGLISRPVDAFKEKLSSMGSWFQPRTATSSAEASRGSLPLAAERAAAALHADGSKSDGSAFGQNPWSNVGICVAIPSSPRAFPHHELPPWHFPVALLKMLDERHSRGSSAHGGKLSGGERSGLGEMRAVVYSAGCKKPVPAAVATNRQRRMGRLRRVRAAKTVEDLEADFVVDETKRANDMIVGYTQEIERVAEGLSMKVDVLSAQEDVCRFIGQEEGELRRGGAEDGMVGKDGWDSWKWRTKLVMDFVYVARQCLATRPKYVLLLQDDTLPAKLYDVGMEKFIKEDLVHKSWGVLSLYNPQSYNWRYGHGDEYPIPCCAQALLFNVTTLEGMLQYMEEHFMETNMDLLVNKYLVETGIKGYVHVPSLFQHLGSIRTKDSGIKRPDLIHVDKDFDENAVVGWA